LDLVLRCTEEFRDFCLNADEDEVGLGIIISKDEWQPTEKT
jgi:hypothetical protein